MTKDSATIKAIYFDLDDTLCAYWDASKKGLLRAFAQCGPEGHSPEELMRHWAATFREFSPTLKQTGWYEGYCVSGEPTRTEQMRLTLERIGIADEAMALELSEAYRHERNAALRLFPDAAQVLEILSNRYPLGLITNGPADIQREEIATLGIARYFKHIFIEGEMKEGKPLPAVFARAAEAMGALPQELLFVGNSYAHDVRPALEEGWHAIWVRRKTDIPPSHDEARRKLEQIPPSGPVPDAVASSLTDVLGYLGIKALSGARV